MMNNQSPTTDPAVRVSDLRVVRGGRVVLDDVSFEVAPGTVTGLLGPSGCGKTTLMRSIVGVQIIEGGTVEVLGQPAGSKALRRSVGYVTQAPSVYADLTVRENLRYFAAVLGAPGSDVDRVVEEVGLNDHVDAVTGRLSGGQEARVSLAAALLGTPQVLVLDEPTVGLDPVLRRDLWDAVRPSGRQRRDAAGEQPRHGRGHALRPAAADARRADPRRRQPRCPPRAHRHRRHRDRLP